MHSGRALIPPRILRCVQDATGSPLLDLPDGVLYAILQQLPGNEPLRLTGVSRALRALVLSCPVTHASLALSCREGEGIVAKRCGPAAGLCPTPRTTTRDHSEWRMCSVPLGRSATMWCASANS